MAASVTEVYRNGDLHSEIKLVDHSGRGLIWRQMCEPDGAHPAIERMDRTIHELNLYPRMAVATVIERLPIFDHGPSLPEGFAVGDRSCWGCSKGLLVRAFVIWAAFAMRHVEWRKEHVF